MPITELSTDLPTYAFLKEIVDDANAITSAFNSIPAENYISNFAQPDWHILPLYDIETGKYDDIDDFVSISNLIENQPKHFKIIAVGISSIPYGDCVWHNDPATNIDNFVRLQIPISNVEGSLLSIVEDGGQVIDYEWEEGKLYQFENPESLHRPSYYGNKNKRRLLLLIDAFLNSERTIDEMKEYYFKMKNNFLSEEQII
jgi:hypothetical protein